jgi:hypothetical protein
MSPNLSTTNVFLGIMAVVSVLEVVAVAALALGAWAIYRRVARMLTALEERRLGEAFSRIDAILDDVKTITSTVRHESGQIERLIRWIIETINRKRHRAAPKTSETTGPVM